MRLHRPPERRHGAVAVEAAIVYPVLFFLLLAMVLGGIGVFRYQQVALLAREAARYAAVRGGGWQEELRQPSPTQQQVIDAAVAPLAAGMEPQLLGVQIQWVNTLTGEVRDWDPSSKQPASRTAAGEPVTNKVRVTVTYQWFPGVLLPGPLTLQSASEIPMAF